MSTTPTTVPSPSTAAPPPPSPPPPPAARDSSIRSRYGDRRSLHIWGGLLFLGVVASLLATEGNEGFGRDEAQYMRAAERHWGWFDELGQNARRGHPRTSFTAANIDHYWSDNAPDHPVVMKTLYGLSWRAFHRCTCAGAARGLHPIPVRGRHVTLPIFARESTAFRFPAIVMSGLLAWLVFRFARRFVATPAALASGVMAIAQPHYFFHAPIACFDAPITTMAFAVGFAYWKSLTSWRWGVLTGLVFGLALGVKHNAWLMPFFLLAHYLWMRRRDVLLGVRVPRVPLAFVSMAVLGPMVFFLHWPWLWHHPIERTRTYLNRHLQHEHYNFEYLGRNWNLPPTDRDLKWLRATFPVVSTALTVPVTTLALALAGSVVLASRRKRIRFTFAASSSSSSGRTARPDWRRPGADVDPAFAAFLAAQTLGPLAVLSLPATPIFGGVKHFMPAMPYLAVVAAVGLSALASAAARTVAEHRGRWVRTARALPVGLAALVTLPGIVETRRSLPDGLSHYNMLAGGFAGGASLGMNRQFWAYCVLPMLGWVNQRTPQNHLMYWHDVLGDALAMYKREGRLSLAVGDTGFAESGVEHSMMGIIVYEKHWALYEKFIWDHYGTLRPSFVRTREGVPLVIGYERPR